MTRFTNVDVALFHAYQQIAEESKYLFGHDIRVTRAGTGADVPLFRVTDDGNLHYRLPGRTKSWIADLVLPVRAKADPFATSLAVRFANICRTLQFRVRQARDVRVYLVREGRYIRDNLVVSRSHTGGKKLYLLDTIAAVRDTLSFRYEGAAVDLGVALTWNWQALQEAVLAAGCSVLRFEQGFKLRDRLGRSKSSHLLADGVTSFFVATPEGHVDRLVVLPARRMQLGPPEWQLVPREYRYVASLVRGHDAFIAANRRNEVWLFTKSAAVKWAENVWHRVTTTSLTPLLSQFLPKEAAARLAELLVVLSSRRLGALISVCRDPSQLMQEASPGLRREFGAELALPITDVSVEFLTRVAAVDGATLLNSRGELVNAGVILKVPAEHTAAGEGARTAAASYAGTKGLAIKVSHDGPVTVYIGSHVVLRAA